jgi:hypothetical protein
MLDLPGLPVLDKETLIGGCLRIPLEIDAARLQQEVLALPETLWGSAGGRVGVHRAAEALFLRGYAPAEGEQPIADREALARLPYSRWIIEQLIPGIAQRCLLARLPVGASVAPHVDRAPYFFKTLRFHVPVFTHERVWMLAGDQLYSMRAGEIWVLNNSGPHAVWNEPPGEARTHLICDFEPTPALLALLDRGERDLGRNLDRVTRHFALAAQGAKHAE